MISIFLSALEIFLLSCFSLLGLIFLTHEKKNVYDLNLGLEFKVVPQNMC